MLTGKSTVLLIERSGPFIGGTVLSGGPHLYVMDGLDLVALVQNMKKEFITIIIIIIYLCVFFFCFFWRIFLLDPTLQISFLYFVLLMEVQIVVFERTCLCNQCQGFFGGKEKSLPFLGCLMHLFSVKRKNLELFFHSSTENHVLRVGVGIAFWGQRRKVVPRIPGDAQGRP